MTHSKEHLKFLRTTTGGHFYEGEHGCTPECLEPAGVKVYVCTLCGRNVCGEGEDYAWHSSPEHERERLRFASSLGGKE